MTQKTEKNINTWIPLLCTVLSVFFIYYSRYDDKVDGAIEKKVSKDIYEVRQLNQERKATRQEITLSKIDDKLRDDLIIKQDISKNLGSISESLAFLKSAVSDHEDRLRDVEKK